MTTINNIEIVKIPRVHDVRGNLSVIEGDVIPFEMKRVYYLFDIPTGSERGGHAHKNLKQLLIAISGSFEVILHDGNVQQKITLNRPDEGLLIPPGIWRELKNFSSGAVCLVLASEVYKEEDYIRNFNDFISFKNGIR